MPKSVKAPKRAVPKAMLGVRIEAEIKEEIERAAGKKERTASWLGAVALRRGWEAMKLEDKELAA